MSQDALIREELSHEEAHQISVGLLRYMEELPPELAAAATMMTLGRITSPRILQPEEEVKFIETISEYVSLYFMEGSKQ